MRYATLVAASVAVVGTFAFARDGRGEQTPAVAAQTAPAVVVRHTSQEDFRWAGRLARGQEIEIRGIAGNVRAEPSSGDQVEVVGRRTGEGARHVRIEVVESDAGVIVCAIYPTRGRRSGNRDGDAARGRSTDRCSDNGGEGGEIDMDDARVDFTVRVPAGVKFASRSVAGDVNATGLRGPVDVATVSGNVRVSTTGTARASTVSGNVEATFGETDGEEMEFNSVSGDVTLRLAGDVGARVSMHTLSGDIDSDFDLRTSDEDADDDFGVRIGSQATGTIGRGGPALSVNTVSGDIRLERAR